MVTITSQPMSKGELMPISILSQKLDLFRQIYPWMELKSFSRSTFW